MKAIKALTNVTIIDGTGKEPVPNGVVVINEQGEIHSWGEMDEIDIPSDAEIRDYQGKTLMPGIVDTHVHFCFEPCADPFSVLTKESDARTGLKAASYALKTLLSGVTTVRDMGGKNYVDLDLRDSIHEGKHLGPRMFASGKILTMTGGHGWAIGEEIDGESEARKGARKQLKKGADLLKIMATGGVMTEGVEPGSPQLTKEEIKAAVEEAHKGGKKTATHAQGIRGIKNAIEAGIDSVEHGIFLDNDIIETMVEQEVYLVPTLSAPYWISEKGREAGIPEHAVKKSDAIIEDHVSNFKKAYEAGVNIALGTDAGTPFNEHGKNSFELELMVKHGMDPLEAIKTATYMGAELLGISDKVGQIAPGLYADLLIIDGDPVADIEDIEKIHSIYKMGREIKPEELTIAESV
ncbi:metal-dependent hydrolase family protein [Natranaerobius thermophilus]|uniref:Amidohydrolase n=1 Tax=Natranaerobius thermophilus (strain ATCC BAA-1301 / DSM 18059 / JW/NM-WN-LF) TaxID=457570 RepID=B2A2Q1_NATTJ|nr:amidohydrolase family protein [Natranaerobius thermophilus]ACB86269.1 amidohydrolase [Natranaerobius thermophilus JW/NM-WN-LF]